MLKIKFFVVVIYFSLNCACYTKYCRICQNHTLCKFKIPGPSPKCIGYEANALLKDEDHRTLINKINERRNYIAIGHSRLLPSAANMKKIEWSDELASFAQRWVDQCDQSLRPDKEDQCRDLDNFKVGQNIATITGTSSGLSVKSFVEIWFMESMVYTGSVTYYNQSNDYKSNYFTQLIWADSDRVGCGKAKFFIKNIKPILVERLVCNFATKGNIHGKPVYTIGYAATQCGDDMGRDDYFPGLCSYRTKLKRDKIVDSGFQYTEDNLSSATPLATSLLRIRNLINDSSRQDLDPIYHNSKLLGKHFEDKNDQVYRISIQDDAVKRSYPSIEQNFWNNKNSSRNHGEHFHHHEKGHSRVYHNHNHNYRNEFDSIHADVVRLNTQEYDYKITRSNQDYRKNNKQCTRKLEYKPSNNSTTKYFPYKGKLRQCTRSPKNNCLVVTHICQENQPLTTTYNYPRELCPCSILQSDYSISLNPCNHNMNCDCGDVNTHTGPRVNKLRTLRGLSKMKLEKPDDSPFYYDFIGNETSQDIHPVTKLPRTSYIFSNDVTWLPHNKLLKVLDSKKDFNKNYSDRSRRMPEEKDKLNAFWQTDEFINKNQKQLKSIRYTTLSNKKKKEKKSKSTSRDPIKTEPITLTYKYQNNKRVTEKYLSFDELIHLRKYDTSEFSGRRQYDDKQILRESNTSSTTQPTENTSEYTPNTPYVRMKHCTRKLTCTWTAASLTDSAGSIIPGGGAGAAGSRTPPGYVEGCTRTSTCTRDYMHRNKMATLPVETTSPEPEPGDDEDYCERRALNRRSLVEKHLSRSDIVKSKLRQNTSFCNKTNIYNLNDYICRKTSRRKRDNLYQEKRNYSKNIKREKNSYYDVHKDNLLSYGDLFYYIAKKILEIQKSKTNSHSCDKCMCNSENKMCFYKLLLFIIFLIE